MTSGYTVIAELVQMAIADAAVSAAVSSRIYIEQGQFEAGYPNVVISVVSREESPTQDTGSAIDEYRVQVDVYARPSSGASAFAAADDIAHKLRAAWSRQNDTKIESIQEAGYRTDHYPENDVVLVSNDYMIRVLP